MQTLKILLRDVSVLWECRVPKIFAIDRDTGILYVSSHEREEACRWKIISIESKLYQYGPLLVWLIQIILSME